ncbi:hypothetical protein [Streptomyces anulatus]|uniref:hypothetical protein n=1 Tax=Streptomyces anulatus TaxID=1892 RepID=UPI003654DA9B
MTTATLRGAPPEPADCAPPDCSLVVDADADTDVDTDVDADGNADCPVMALLLATGVAVVP